MPANKPEPKDTGHGDASQSAEDEPYQHGALSGNSKPGKAEKPTKGVTVNRTSVGQLPNVPDEPAPDAPSQN